MAKPLMRIEGLDQFSQSLDKVDSSWSGAIREANMRTAIELQARAQMRASIAGGVARLAAESLRVTPRSSAAMLTGGGTRAPYFMGAEFGASRYRQFKTWQGNQWQGWQGGPGYFIGATVRRDGRALIDAYMARLDQLYAVAFPN